VLVVEDNKFSLTWITTFLKKMKVEPVLAENGQEAVEKFQTFIKEGVLFEMILMDLFMPVMNGYDATIQIRNLEKQFKLSDTEKHFICGISADLTTATETKCMQCGMNNVKPKPLNKNTLEDLVRQNRRKSNIIGQNKTADTTMETDDQQKEQMDLTIINNVALNYL